MDRWSRNRSTLSTVVLLSKGFRSSRFPPCEVVFINLAYRPGESPPFLSSVKGRTGILWAQSRPCCLPDGGKHLFHGERFPARLLYARSFASLRTRDANIVHRFSRPLICQIILALEKGTLVSDLGVNGRSRAHGVRVSRKTTRLN